MGKANRSGTPSVGPNPSVEERLWQALPFALTALATAVIWAATSASAAVWVAITGIAALGVRASLDRRPTPPAGDDAGLTSATLGPTAGAGRSGLVESNPASAEGAAGTESGAMAGGPERARIPPLAFLRSMWSIFWSAMLHPRSTTEVDLSTGRSLRRY